MRSSSSRSVCTSSQFTAASGHENGDLKHGRGAHLKLEPKLLTNYGLNERIGATTCYLPPDKREQSLDCVSPSFELSNFSEIPLSLCIPLPPLL